MLISQISTEPVYLTDLNFGLMFDHMEFRIDQSSIVIKVDVKNTGKYEENLSNHHFTLASNIQSISPSASYISDESVTGKVWSRKVLKPDYSCTIIFKFNMDTSCEDYEFNYYYRNSTKLIKRFQVN